ncbi:MAG: bifunctional diaminohydroxyphosphoribosylaminopyrimidine deaminase/5-amino-6-(5-phosphoribosylamino)uracil reductase RibD [Candidatus Micrarchaeota archaeon]
MSKYMKLALELAKNGTPSPNPYCGAVIVKNGKIIGRGFHARAGEAHAEVNALREAGEKARGAVLYVTLEPCSHYGKTPPCTKAIIEAGIKRVVYGARDVNPLVQGEEELKKEGVEVKGGVMKKECEELNEIFFKFMESKLPFVLLKSAMSLDGKIACASGDSKWISGEEAREYSHALRSEYDAILVGINTVLKDNPKLTSRVEGGRNPLRVILDSKLRIPLDANVLADSNVIIATSEKFDEKKKRVLERKGVRVLVLGKERVGMRALMKKLGELGVTSVLIEGGGEVSASALKEKIVDKVLFFIAPKIIGGRSAPSPVGGEGAKSMREALKLARVSFRKVGEDLAVEAYTAFI